MSLQHSRLVLAALLSALLVVVAGLVALAVSGGHSSTNGQRSVHSRTRTTPLFAPSGWHPVSPTTVVLPATPVQQRYDQGFREGFSSAANRGQMARVAALQLPPPAVGGHWPALVPTSTPNAWSREFTAGLLNIDFASQSRGRPGRLAGGRRGAGPDARVSRYRTSCGPCTPVCWNRPSTASRRRSRRLPSGERRPPPGCAGP